MSLIYETENKLAELCKLLNTSAQVYYSADKGKYAWNVSLRGIYFAVETGSTMRMQDGTVKRLLAGASASSAAATFAEAVENLRKRTVESPHGVLISNTEFGLFSMMDDDVVHTITPLVDGKLGESFEYDEEKVRSLLHQYQGVAT